MKITVELPEKDLRDICRLTGEKKKGPAIRKLLVDALMLRRRREIAGKFVSGEFGTEAPPWQETRARDKQKDAWNS